MRIASALLPAAVVALGLVLLVAPRGAGAADADVNVGSPGNRFSPNSVQIEPGDTVTFHWASGTHTVTFVQGGLLSAINATTHEATTSPFASEGMFYYYCSIHSNAGAATPANIAANSAMVGRVVVGDAPTNTPAITTATATRTVTASPTTTVPAPGETPASRVIGPNVAKN